MDGSWQALSSKQEADGGDWRLETGEGCRNGQMGDEGATKPHKAPPRP